MPSDVWDEAEPRVASTVEGMGSEVRVQTL